MSTVLCCDQCKRTAAPSDADAWYRVAFRRTGVDICSTGCLARWSAHREDLLRKSFENLETAGHDGASAVTALGRAVANT